MDGEASLSVRLQEPPFALPFDTILHGRYMIERVLGYGGFGITYQGQDLENHTLTAIKEYYPNGVVTRIPGTTEVVVNSSYEQFRLGKENFLQEARIIYHCNNTHIARIYSLFEEYGTAYYVMEFLEGQDLMHFLKSRGGRIGWRELEPIALQVMDALILVHGKGVIHRDVSPENIYLCHNNYAKLIDFGTAVSKATNQAKAVVLKKGYAPPEQYDPRGRQGVWTDIYALGATMYRALTGKIPPEAMERLEHDTLRRPSLLGAEVSSHIEAALMQSMSLDVNGRFLSIEAFRNAIQSSPTSVDMVAKGVRAVSEGLTSVVQAWAHVRPHLDGVDGIYFGQRFELDRDITFGRDPGSCNVIFPADAVGISKIHCQISLNVYGHQAVITDCNSTNGTFLNGVRLVPGKPAVLQAGNIITFGGNNTFRFEL